MFKINNKNLISLSFGLLLIFILLPTSANAYYYVGWEGNNYVGYSIDNGPNYNNNLNPIPVIISLNPDSTRINTNTTVAVTGNNFVQGSIVKLNNNNLPTTFINSGNLRAQLGYSDLNSRGNYQITVFNPAPGGGYSNAVSFVVNANPVYYGGNTSNTSRTNNSNTSTTNNITNETTTGSTNETNVKDLAAGAIFGSNGFLPSSIFQWIFFFILILLAVILWRKLYVTEEDKHTPLKHA